MSKCRTCGTELESFKIGDRVRSKDANFKLGNEIGVLVKNDDDKYPHQDDVDRIWIVQFASREKPYSHYHYEMVRIDEPV